MRLIDRLVGTKHPAPGVTAQSAAAVRAALLAVATPDAPYSVDEEEDGRLRAQWRIEEPAWRTFFAERNVDRSIAVTMRLDEEACEVRHVTEQFTVTREKGALSFRKGATYSRGNSRSVSKRWTIGGGEGTQETFSFDSADLTSALASACLEHGWTWKGVIGKP